MDSEPEFGEESINELISEEDSREYKGKMSYKGLDPSILPQTPLAKLLASERKEIVRQRMIELEPLLTKSLNLKEHAFLQTILGKDWGKELYLPSLEFFEDVSEYKDKMLPEVKERLNILIDAIYTTPIGSAEGIKEKAVYLISLPYFLTTEKETIEIYEAVLSKGRHGFPIDFFRYDHNRKAGIVTRYMYEKIIGFKPEETFTKAKRKDFGEHSLSHMLKSYFNDSVQKAVQNAYPKSKYLHLYKKDDVSPEKNKTSKGLHHLIDSLDTIFNYDS